MPACNVQMMGAKRKTQATVCACGRVRSCLLWGGGGLHTSKHALHPRVCTASEAPRSSASLSRPHLQTRARTRLQSYRFRLAVAPPTWHPPVVSLARAFPPSPLPPSPRLPLLFLSS